MGVEDPILQMGTQEGQIPQNDCTLLTNYVFTAKTTKEFEPGVQKEPSWTSRWRNQVRTTDPGVRDVLKGGCHRSQAQPARLAMETTWSLSLLEAETPTHTIPATASPTPTKRNRWPWNPTSATVTSKHGLCLARAQT